MKTHGINYPLLLLVAAVIGCLAFFGIKRLDIHTNIIESLPANEQVIVDALEIFANHPIHEQVAVDIMIDRDAPDILVECSAFLQAKMRASGLFAETGLGHVGALVPELAGQIVGRLSSLFSRQELEDAITPRLQTDAIHRRLQELVEGMGSLEGIGQTSFISTDPLGLKDLVLTKLIHLAPSPQATFYQGNLISKDGRHLLVTGRPTGAGTDTATARKLADLFTAASRELAGKYAPAGIHVTVTPVGAYRAALDNEEIIRHDVQLALALSTIGIALLLFLAFPRPLLGLLSLLPSLAGTATALFVYSLFNSSISIMVLGFGGALLAITVDHGIAYLLFLDRPQATEGKLVAREVRSIGTLTALLTSIGAFTVLSLSDFPVFTELGQFTALGFLFTYLFIHTIFPRIFPAMPASANRTPPLHRLTGVLYGTGKPGAVTALLLALVLLFFAKPEFRISLSDMNTVSERTLAADQLFTEVWGDLGKKVYLMSKAPSMAELQRQNDILLSRIEKDIEAERIQATFVPSMIFPGQQRSLENRAAWQDFWTTERAAQVKRDLTLAGTALGFRADAFAPFFALLEPSQPAISPALSPRYSNLLGITAGKTGELVQFIIISPGEKYDAAGFLEDYGDSNRIFDATYFSTRLGEILFSTFSSMLTIIAAMVTLILFVLFLNWRLTCITLLPPLFAYICTLGTLKLIGHPLDIPGLMLSVVILGMGVDYSIYTVCGCQWYGNINHPSHTLVRSTVCLAGASTLIGFGVLCFAEHSLLRSVGITSLCGIGYSLLGTFLLLPPLLKAYFRPEEENGSRTGTLQQRILRRYRLLEAYPRMFARLKLRFDPLFRDLPLMLAERKDIGVILDIGCGYGLPACWCLEYLPKARVIGIDPDPARVRIAGRVLRERGTISTGFAPDLPEVPASVDVVLLLDMLHYLDDQQLAATLERSCRLLAPGGILVARFVVRPPERRSFSWYFEDFRVRVAGKRTWYRRPEDLAPLMTRCGFVILTLSPTPSNDELFWLVGRAGELAE
jgi:uncharacterized protein